MGGEFLLRIEDLDPGRSKAEHTQGIGEDLAWLGLDFDGEVMRQSERGPAYDAALELLSAQGLVYPCTCSRADIARAASAPHASDEGPRYPGTCRTGVSHPGRPQSMRFTAASGLTVVHDEVCGRFAQDVQAEVGDFVVRRADGVASYQLAVVVDDIAQGITHVLRGDDLLSSTPRQALLYRALSSPEPVWAHVPLLLTDDGERMAKRDGGATVAGLRAAGWAPERVVARLARSAGIADVEGCRPAELLPRFSLGGLNRAATRF